MSGCLRQKVRPGGYSKYCKDQVIIIFANLHSSDVLCLQFPKFPVSRFCRLKSPGGHYVGLRSPEESINFFLKTTETRNWPQTALHCLARLTAASIPSLHNCLPLHYWEPSITGKYNADPCQGTIPSWSMKYTATYSNYPRYLLSIPLQMDCKQSLPAPSPHLAMR